MKEIELRHDKPMKPKQWVRLGIDENQKPILQIKDSLIKTVVRHNQEDTTICRYNLIKIYETISEEWCQWIYQKFADRIRDPNLSNKEWKKIQKKIRKRFKYYEKVVNAVIEEQENKPFDLKDL